MTLSTAPIAYQGRADHVWPPFTEGWAEVPYDHDASAVQRARGMLGSLPPYHYVDDMLPSGLYRFFAFETPVGTSISALKFVGEDQARALLLGQAPSSPSAVADWIDTNAVEGGLVQLESGGALPEDNSQVTGSGTGNAGVHVVAAAYPSLDAAALAFNAALNAHGYRRADQAIYAGFQLKAGDLTVDAFPGTNTMNRLRGVLAAMSPPVAMANVRIYPWLATTSSGGTGVAAYDGTNAPTWAQWTGAGTGAPTVAKAGVTGAGGIVAAIAAVAVVTAGVIAKSAGAF